MDCDNIGEILKINNGLGVALSRLISLSKEPNRCKKVLKKLPGNGIQSNWQGSFVPHRTA